MNCPRCAHPVLGSADFCGTCGYPLTAAAAQRTPRPATPAYPPPSPAAPEPDRPGPGRWVIVAVVAVLAVAAIALAGIALLRGNHNDEAGQGSVASTPATPSPSPTDSATGPTGAASTPPSSTPVPTVPTTPLRTVVVTGTVSGSNYTVRIWASNTTSDCADHAYGTPVVAYLTAHPCTSMTRVLGTTEVNDRPVAFALTSIGFPGGGDDPYKVAGDFRTLVTKDGTGNLNDLLREGQRLPSGPTAVPTANAFSTASQDVVVFIVEAWYLDGSTPADDPDLTKLASDFFLQPGVVS